MKINLCALAPLREKILQRRTKKHKQTNMKRIANNKIDILEVAGCYS
jgi:hypothetical protein